MKDLFLLRKIAICCAIIAGITGLYGQKIPEKGVPWIDNYTTAQYKNHGKIWNIGSAKNGIIYMAGDRGLLEYDGQTWNQFKGSEGYTRSLSVASDSIVYTGSDLDFGVWKKNELNQFVYTSLYPFNKDPNKENEEFWNVCQINAKVIFVSFNNIYVYQNEQLTKIAAPNRFAGCFQGENKMYLADEKNGLYEFNGIELKLVFPFPGAVPFHISGVFETQNGLLVITKNSGLFKYNSGKVVPLENAVSGLLKKDQVFCSTQINNTYFAFGTILNGLYITDINGNIIQHVNRKKGLLNNTILSMHHAANGILWLGMDYGIAAMHLYSNLTYFFDYQGDYGSAQSALLKNGVFYLGTNQGLYKAEWRDLNNGVNTKPFSLVAGSEGQVWTLNDVNGTILCGHDKGLFVVSGNTMQRIYSEPGVWTILPFKEKYLLTGNYNGISVFNLIDGKYTFSKKIDLILGSCNQLIIEKENIFWVNIPNYGLIRFSLDSAFFPQDRKIFPSSSFSGGALYILKDQKGINLLTSEYRYLYNREKNQFIKQGPNVLPGQVSGLQEGNYIPIQLNDHYQFYPIYNGFALSNTSIVPQSKTQDYSVLVRSVEAFNNQTRQLISSSASVPFLLNNLRFNFIVPHKKKVLYQYKLEHYSKQWSNWTGNTSIDFLNLAEGNYTLKIRAQIDEATTKISEVSFRVLPPWYRTKLAYLAYVVLAILLFLLIRERQNFRLREQKKLMLKKEQDSLRRQAEKYKQEAMLLKQQQLEHEKSALKQQVKHKSIELAKQAKENENKNRLLHLLKEKIDTLQYEPGSKMRWAEIKRLLDLYLETEDKTFEIQIDELHQEFFQKLRDQFPDLSLYDLRLCAYLKIGLNSKEISEILKVLPSSINVSRSRLRKKLNLRQDEDLFGYLNQIR